MKKTMALLIFMVLCALGGLALAEQKIGMTAADKARILPGLPEGMAATCSVTDGCVDIVIDTYKTDWDMVATAARKSGSLVIHPGIAKPESAQGAAMQSDYYRYEGENTTQSEERILSQFQDAIQSKPDMGSGGYAYSCSYQGWSIGRYDEGTGLFLPEAIPQEQGAGFSACWKMNDGSYRAERVRFTVSYTETPPIYVTRRGVAQKDVAPNVNTGSSAMIDLNAVISAKTEEGRIVYTLKNDAANREVFTAVAVPDGMNGDSVRAFLLSDGKETELTVYPSGNYMAGKRCVVLPYKIDAKNCIYKKDWAIKWMDSQNKRIVRYLEAEFHVGNPELTVTYPHDGEPGAVPLPAASLTWQISNPLDGLSVSYRQDTGVFHMDIDEDRLPANRKTDLSQTTVSAQVIAPQNAASCIVFMFRGDVIYGDSGERAWRLGQLSVKPGQPVIVPELTQRIFFREIPVTLHNGKQMSYYVAPLTVGQYGGETLVFEWLDASGTRIGNRQYVALTTDAYQVAIQRNPSETKNPNKLVEIPTVQTQGSPINVETAELPQMGENVVRYEIALLDEDGNKAQPDAPVLVYLPYPDGRTMEECEGCAFVVYHELSDGSYEEYSTQNGRLTLTEYGLCMEVTSFSPYFLHWEEGEEAPDASALPKTGDSSNLGLYALMLAICAAVLLMEKRACRRGA